jgi:alginate lyase
MPCDTPLAKRLRACCSLCQRINFLALVLLLALVAPATPQGFQHPGVLLNRAQLLYIKQQVDARIEPFYSAFIKARDSSYGSLTYKPQGPPADGIIECGSYSNPNVGCTAEHNDGSVAYVQALLYWLTGNPTYARNAITILDTYAQRLKNYTNANAPLQAAWGASKWARAAELIRYSNAGWPATSIQAFERMLKTITVPLIFSGSPNNGNWELSMIEALIGIAVFTNDPSLFAHALTFWHQRIPAYFFYAPIDGGQAVAPPRGSLNWHGQTVFNNTTSGHAQETCRDFEHTYFGIAATMAAAETAWIQGVNLYGSQLPRLHAALEYHAYYQLGNTVPDSVCRGNLDRILRPTYEIGYNTLHNRLAQPLPNTLQLLVTQIRTMQVPVDRHMVLFETLSHGGDVANRCVTSGGVG